MGLMKPPTEPNRIEGPMPCDVTAVQTVYRELAVRIRPMPAETITKAGDEGKEPEAGDTPIIKRPR